MSRTFKIIKDYYEEGIELYKSGSITIRKGVTTLVGCNGSGKTTLLNILKQKLEKQNIPCLEYSNLKDGGRNAMEKMLYFGMMNDLALSAFSSEGECIVQNFGNFISQIRDFFRTGKSNHSFKEPNSEHKERWILLDAVDSGLSIDNMIEVKELFNLIKKDAKNAGVDLYIVISTNAFEFAKDTNCLDVYEGKYIKFTSYDEYTKFILKTKEIKNKRYDN